MNTSTSNVVHFAAMTDTPKLPALPPVYFMNKDGLNEVHEGRLCQVYEQVSIGIDPAKPFTDYGCAVVHRLNDEGDFEIVHVEYLEPNK